MDFRFVKALRTFFDPKEYDEQAEYRRRILTEYKNKRPLYEDFCTTVFKLTEAFLKEGDYRYQLTHRTKSPESLREKLIRKEDLGIVYEQLDDIEDLAGIRVIFYSERDKDRFIRGIQKEASGMLRIEERNRENGYEATHIIMSFGPKRLRLSEYRHFKGLKCEIQVTTILRHAWAEIQHDLVYKDIFGLKEKDPQQMDTVQKKLEDILHKHIKLAAEEFEEIIEHLNGKK